MEHGFDFDILCNYRIVGFCNHIILNKEYARIIAHAHT